MNDFIALASAALVIGVFYQGFQKFTEGNFTAYWASLIGFSGLCILDIAKYYYIDADRLGWMGSTLFQITAMYVWITFFLFCIFYRIFSFKNKEEVGLKIDNSYFIWKKRGKFFWNFAKIIVIPMSFIVGTSENNTTYFFIILSGVMKGLPCAIILIGLLIKDRSAVIVGSLGLFIGVDDSSRRAYIAIALPIVLVIWTYLNHYFQKRNIVHNIIFKMVTFFIIVTMFIFLNFLRSEHNYGDGFNPDSRVENTITYITTMKSIDTFDNTAFIIREFPAKWHYYKGETYSSIMVAAIPRSWWFDKPAGFSAHLGLMRNMEYRGFDEDLWYSINRFSLSPGLVGEAYANFGPFGIILITIAWALITTIYDNRIKINQINVYNAPGLLFISSFVLVSRGDFYSSLNFQIFLYLTAKILVFLIFGTKDVSRRMHIVK